MSGLHAFEYFTKQRYYKKTTITPKDIYNLQDINYDSLFIMIINLFILTTIISLEYVLALLVHLFPSSFFYYICECADGPVSDRGKLPKARPLASRMKLRNKRGRHSFSYLDRHHLQYFLSTNHRKVIINKVYRYVSRYAFARHFESHRIFQLPN